MYAFLKKCGAMETDSQSIHILPSEATSAVNTIPTEVTASASRHPATHIETAKEPNDSDASSEEIPPQRKGSSRLAARLSKIKPQHEVAVLRKLPGSVKYSGTIGQTKPERRLSEEETSSSDDSDASWEPSDSERDPGPRAKRRARDAPRKHQSSDKGPTSAKPQKDNMEMKTPTVNRSSSTSSTKPQETNKVSSCVVTPPSNTATQRPVGPPTPNPATLRPVGPPTPNPATLRPVGPPTPNPATQPPAGLPEEVIKVGMVVLARRRISTWHQGKIVEIKPVEKGHKYKVDFEEHGRSWLSGHHMAFLPPPLLEHLYEGARVVAMYKEPEGDQSWFYSGTLAELPNRKNQSRFLVFFDDGTPSYVRLPVLHLVCRPLQHGTPSWEEDIEDESYRDFLLYYLNEFPNQPMAHYNVGQQINVDYNGVHKRCRVETIDCSLLHVLFLDDQHKEWVYRGSMRLQHMANMKKKRESSVCKTGESSTATTSKVTDSNSSRAQC